MHSIFGPYTLYNYQSEGMGMGWGLELKSDSTYNYHSGSCVGSSSSNGRWYKSGDTIILNSFTFPQIISQEETIDTSAKHAHILINGYDKKPYKSCSLYLDTRDTSIELKDTLDIDEFRESNFDKIYFGYHIPSIQLSTLGRNYRIKYGKDDLNFTVRDTSANSLTVTLNIIQTYFNDTSYYKNEKYLITSDSLLFQTLDGKYYREYPAILQRRK